jgi:hypothetical protein
VKRVLFLAIAACSQTPQVGPVDAGDEGMTMEAPPDGSLPTHPKSLPFAYTRAENGTPIDAATISAKTDVLLDLLTKTRYFGFVDERVHGWPESDPKKRFWYGVWWTGVDVHVEAGKVTYFHNMGGAENAGINTSPMLEGACYAHLLWPDARLAHLTRRIIRGLSSWIMAMQRSTLDQDTLLARAAYPAAIQSSPVLGETSGVSYFIDYSLNHPGTDSGSSEYVHVPLNPFWGDLWIKNKRSKDDIGHMFRAIAQIDACDGTLSEPGAQDDLVQLRKLYQSWARRVEDDKFAIATLDKSDNVVIPDGMLAHYSSFDNVECNAMLALRLFGRVTPNGMDCGNGISPLDEAAIDVNRSNGEILRSSHEAAANHALLSNNVALAKPLLEGLAKRIDTTLDQVAANMPPPFFSNVDLSKLIVSSANVGVPLTWREVAWLHQQIDLAHQTYLAPSNDVVYKSFVQGTPDGSYLYEPAGDGFSFAFIGALLGTCASQWRNPASHPVLDCAKIKAFKPVY